MSPFIELSASPLCALYSELVSDSGKYLLFFEVCLTAWLALSFLPDDSPLELFLVTSGWSRRVCAEVGSFEVCRTDEKTSRRFGEFLRWVYLYCNLSSP